MTSSRALRLLVLPGDGVGPEVVAEALRVLRAVLNAGGVGLEMEEDLVGGASLDARGTPLSPATLDLARSAGAVLLGAVGGPRWDALPAARRAERGLLDLRSALGVYANLRPARAFPALADHSPLRPEVLGGADLLIVRELCGGLYYGEPRGIDGPPGGRRGINTMVYTEEEVRRLGVVAFEAARRRRKRLCSVDKANVLEAGALWREVMTELGQRQYPDVALDHLYVDACAMALVTDPGRFDVLAAGNLFGDVLSDEAAALTGSLGMLPSASLGDGPGLYEPVHGSAPNLAGRGVANPLGAILSAAMLLEHTLWRPDLSSAVRGAVQRVLDAGLRTPDLLRGAPGPGTQEVGTAGMGEAVAGAALEILGEGAA